MTKHDKCILTTIVVGTLLQGWLVARIIYTLDKIHSVRHFAPRDSYYIWNVVVAGLVLIMMAGVLRTGRWRQRAAALLVCICPVIVICDSCEWSLNLLSRP